MQVGTRPGQIPKSQVIRKKNFSAIIIVSIVVKKWSTVNSTQMNSVTLQ